MKDRIRKPLIDRFPLPKDVREAVHNWNLPALQACVKRYQQLAARFPKKANRFQQVLEWLTKLIDKAKDVIEVRKRKVERFIQIKRVKRLLATLKTYFKDRDRWQKFVAGMDLEKYQELLEWIAADQLIKVINGWSYHIVETMQNVYPNSDKPQRQLTPGAAWLDYSLHCDNWVAIMQLEAIEEAAYNAKQKASKKGRKK